MPGLREFAITLTADVGGMVRGIKRGTEAFDAFGFETRLVLRTIGTAITALGAGISTFVAFGVNEFKKFEKELNNFTTLLFDDASTATNEITQLTEEYTKAILDLSVASGKTAVDLARGLYDVISAGSQSITDSSQAIEVLTVATQLSVAGLSSVETAADGVTTIMNAYATSNVSAAEAADFLSNTVIRGKTRLDELNGSMGRLAPLASQVGISLRDLSIILAQTTRSGLKTDEAITSIRGIMRSFIKPTAQVREAAKLLAIQLDDSSFSIDVNAIRTKGLVGILGQLATRYRSLTGKDQADFVNQLGEIFPRIRGLSGGIASLTQFLTGFGTELELDIEAAERTGTALKQFEDQTDTLAFATDRLSSSIAALAIQSVDGALTPALKLITNSFTFLLEVLRDIPILGDLIALFAGIIGPIVTATGAIILFAAEIAILDKFILPLFIAQMTRMGISVGLLTLATNASTLALSLFAGAVKTGILRLFGTLPTFAAFAAAAFLGVKALGALLDVFVESKDVLTEEEKSVISISENIRDNVQRIKDLEEAKKSALLSSEEKINLDTRIKNLTEGITKAQLDLNEAIEATPAAKAKQLFEDLTETFNLINNLGETKGDGFFAQLKDAFTGFPEQLKGLFELFKISGVTLDVTEALAKVEADRAAARKKFNELEAIAFVESATFREEELEDITNALRLDAEKLEAQKDALGASDLRLEALNKEIDLAKALAKDKKKSEFDLAKLEQDRAKEETKRAEIVRKLNSEIAQSNAAILASKAEEFAINVGILQQQAEKTLSLEDDRIAQIGLVLSIDAEIDAREAALVALRASVKEERALAQDAKLTEQATQARVGAIQANINKSKAEIEALKEKKRLELETLEILRDRNRELELSREKRLAEIDVDRIRLDIASKITGVEEEQKQIEIELTKLVAEELRLRNDLLDSEFTDVKGNEVKTRELQFQRDALIAQAEAADKLVGLLTRSSFQRGLQNISDAIKNAKFDFEDLADLVIGFAGDIKGELTSSLEGLISDAIFSPEARRAIKSEFDQTMRDLRTSHAETLTEIAKQRAADLANLQEVEAAKRLEIGQTLGLQREELRKELLGERGERIEAFRDEKDDLKDALNDGIEERREAFNREITELNRQLAEKEIKEEDFNKKVAEQKRELAQDILDIESDNAKDLLDARETFNNDIVSLDEDREQQLAAQRAEFAAELETQFSEFVGARADIEDTFRSDLLTSQEQFRTDVAQAMMDLQSALEEQGDPIANFFDNLFAGIIGNFTSLLAQIGGGLITQGFGALASAIAPGAVSAFTTAVEGTAIGDALVTGAGAAAATTLSTTTAAGAAAAGGGGLAAFDVAAPASLGALGTAAIAAIPFVVAIVGPIIAEALGFGVPTREEEIEAQVAAGSKVVIGQFFDLFSDAFESQDLSLFDFGEGFGPTAAPTSTNNRTGQTFDIGPSIDNPLDILINSISPSSAGAGGLRGSEQAIQELFFGPNFEKGLELSIGVPINNIAGDISRTLEAIGLKFAGFLGLAGEEARQFAGNFGASFAESVAAAGGGIEELLGAISVLEQELGVDGATLRNINRIQDRLVDQLDPGVFQGFRNNIITELKALGVDVDEFASTEFDLNFIASALEGTSVSVETFLDLIIGQIDRLGPEFVDLSGIAFETGQAMQLAVRDGFGDIASITGELTPELQANLQSNIGIIQDIAEESGAAALGVVNAIFIKITEIRDKAQAVLDEPTSTPEDIAAATQAIMDADVALTELQAQAESGEFDFAAIFGDLGLQGEELRKFIVGISKELQTAFTDLTTLSEEQLDILIKRGVITIETKTLELQRRLLEAVIDIDTVVVGVTSDVVALNGGTLNELESAVTTTQQNIATETVNAQAQITASADIITERFAPDGDLVGHIVEMGQVGVQAGEDIEEAFIGTDGVIFAGIEAWDGIKEAAKEAIEGPGGMIESVNNLALAISSLPTIDLSTEFDAAKVLPGGGAPVFNPFANTFTPISDDEQNETDNTSKSKTININLNAPKARVVDRASFNEFARDIKDEIERIDNRRRSV